MSAFFRWNWTNGEFEAMAAVKELRRRIYTGAFEAPEIRLNETISGLQRNDSLARCKGFYLIRVSLILNKLKPILPVYPWIMMNG